VLATDIIDFECRDRETLFQERFLVGLCGRLAFGSSTSSMSGGPSGETTASHQNSPTGISCFFKPGNSGHDGFALSETPY
jgi:hypothetical protein